MHRSLLLLILATCLAAVEPLVVPAGTTFTASFGTEKDKGPDKLFDGNPETWMVSTGGQVNAPDRATSVVLTFPAPVADLGGITTGRSCPFKNYWPKVLEF